MLNQSVVAQIRALFVDGATPSQLMRRIAAVHSEDPRLHLIIMDYFKEAFQVPLVRNVVSGEDYSPSLRHSHYNRDVIPEMIQRIHYWNSDSLDGTWLNELAVRSLAEHVTRLSDTRCQELDRVWDTLTNDERLFIVRKIAMKDYNWDVMKSLALLTERLQQKIVELEIRLIKIA